MARDDRNRAMRRVGSRLALVLPVLVVALQSPAAAYDYGPGRQRVVGHFSFHLTPQEVPTGGDPDGSGFAWLDLDQAHGRGCFVIKWKGLDGVVTSAQLHASARHTNGPVRIDLFKDERFAGWRNTISACVQVEDGGNRSSLSARDKIRAIIERPSGYYLNVESTKFKDGAIRGQLDRQ